MAVLEANRVADSGGATLTVPPGTLIFHCANSAPSGFLKANGAAVSRTTYAALFAAVGTTFGAGNGSTTFNLPDLRGEFPRGWDDGRGVDSGRAFASTQAQAYQSHNHTASVSDPGHAHTMARAGVNYFNTSRVQTSDTFTGNISTNAATTGISVSVGASGDTETRPRNIALLACIKF